VIAEKSKLWSTDVSDDVTDNGSLSMAGTDSEGLVEDEEDFDALAFLSDELEDENVEKDSDSLEEDY
jgi:hypothetical protein